MPDGRWSRTASNHFHGAGCPFRRVWLFVSSQSRVRFVGTSRAPRLARCDAGFVSSRGRRALGSFRKLPSLTFGFVSSGGRRIHHRGHGGCTEFAGGENSRGWATLTRRVVSPSRRSRRTSPGVRIAKESDGGADGERGGAGALNLSSGEMVPETGRNSGRFLPASWLVHAGRGVPLRHPRDTLAGPLLLPQLAPGATGGWSASGLNSFGAPRPPIPGRPPLRPGPGDLIRDGRERPGGVRHRPRCTPLGWTARGSASRPPPSPPGAARWPRG